MKILRLNEIYLNNYKGVERLTVPLNFRTTINGRNATGKTTIMDAPSDIFTGKTADGKTVSEIRPHDANGVEVDRIPIIREVKCTINGKEYDIVKTTEQKWLKPRGADVEVFKGNETSFRVNGFDKKAKDFDAFVSEEICDAETLLMCSNATSFLNVLQKSTTDARKLLEKLAGFSVETFIAQNPQYSDITDITQGNAIEDTIKQLKRNLTAQKKEVERRKVELSYEKTRDTKSDKIDILEEEYQIILQKQKEVEEKMNLLDTRSVEELRAKLAQIRSEMSAYLAEETAGYYKAIKDIDERVSELRTRDVNLSTEIQNLSFDIESITLKRESTRKAVLSLYDQYKDVEAGLLIGGRCPVCGTEIKEETESLKERNKDIRERLKAIQKTIDDHEEYIQKSAREFERLTSEQEAKRTERTAVRSLIYEAEEEAKALVKPDPTQDTIYKDLENQASNIEAGLATQKEQADTRRILETRRLELIAKSAQNRAMLETEKGLAEAKLTKVNELEGLLREEVQKCADIERQIDRILNFSIEKNKALASLINPHFRHFHFEFLEYTQEGNPVETCKLVHNGTSYFGGLNGGDKKLVEVYLVAGLQELNGLNLPIWVDEANTIDPWRIPDDLEQQLIVIQRSDDESIVVKGGDR